MVSGQEASWERQWRREGAVSKDTPVVSGVVPLLPSALATCRWWLGAMKRIPHLYCSTIDPEVLLACAAACTRGFLCPHRLVLCHQDGGPCQVTYTPRAHKKRKQLSNGKRNSPKDRYIESYQGKPTLLLVNNLCSIYRAQSTISGQGAPFHSPEH